MILYHESCKIIVNREYKTISTFSTLITGYTSILVPIHRNVSD